jgi:hypothetical protein
VLQIELHRADPPEGWVTRLPGEDQLHFTGWLGLLQAIVELADCSGDVTGGDDR